MKRHSGGYRRTYTFGYTCLIYHATTLFCHRFFSYKDDPLGKTSGQMIGAARSARQNQVEASARAGTSGRQENLQLDVARGSLDELAGDYESFIIDQGEVPWSDLDPRAKELSEIRIDQFEIGDDVLYRYGVYTQEMRKRFSQWLENVDSLVAANSILRVVHRTMALLLNQIKANQMNSEEYQGETGFCPLCGGTLRVRISQGKRFLGCSNYPSCRFTRSLGKGGR